MALSSNRKNLGAWGEQVAADFLKSQGYELVVRNYRCRYGEIDIICRENMVWCFIEVKTRKSLSFGQGYLAVTPLKQRHLITSAFHYMNEALLVDAPARFDIVSINLSADMGYKIDLIKNAFSL